MNFFQIYSSKKQKSRKCEKLKNYYFFDLRVVVAKNPAGQRMTITDSQVS